MRLYVVTYKREIVMLGPDDDVAALALARNLEREASSDGAENGVAVESVVAYSGRPLLPADWSADSLVYHDAKTHEHGNDISVARALEIAPPAEIRRK